ncbi:MAG: tetratricopeptide repeat protein [Candidatus Sericytochromatia bacterium]
MLTDLATLERAYAEALETLACDGAQAALKKALYLYQQAPHWAGSHRLLGRVLSVQQEGARAEAAWRRALFYDPADAESFLLLLRLLRRQSQASRLLVQDYLGQLSPHLALVREINRLYGALQDIAPSEQVLLLAWAERVLACFPEEQGTLDLQGRLAYARADYPLACQAWRQLVALRPLSSRWLALAQAESAQGSPDQALETLQAALQHRPDWREAQRARVQLLLGEQRFDAAFPCWQALMPLEPSLAAWGYQAALTLLERKNYAGAEAYLAACCAWPAESGQPAHVLWAQRALCCHHLADQTGLQQAYQRAADLAPHTLLYRWAELCALPFVYTSREQVQLSRRGFKQGAQRLFERLERAPLRGPSLNAVLDHLRPPFLLAYQGLNDRPLMEFIGQNWERLLRKSGRQLICNHVPEPAKRPLRVGFVSRHFFKHSVLVCYGRTISLLAQDPRFEVVCLHLGRRRDAWTRELETQVSRFVYLADETNVEALILAQQLDVLIYTDIGMDDHTYRLGLHRLAPIQCVLAGHPVTTGLPQIDYFLSSLGEHPDADGHYSESLVRLRGNLSRHRPLELPARWATRHELGLSERAHVYVCPMTLFKVHPDLDDALAAILREDPLGELYFFCDAHGQYHLLLQHRLAQRFPDLAARIHFLPWMSQADFYSVIRAADVVLDTFHFGGGTTTRMVFGLGQPYVSWPGEFLRSRSTRGASLRLGVPECLATDADEYVRIALHLACDRDFRADLQARIRENASKLFVTQRKPQGLMRFLLAAAEAWPAHLTELTSPFGVSQSPQSSGG